MGKLGLTLYSPIVRIVISLALPQLFLCILMIFPPLTFSLIFSPITFPHVLFHLIAFTEGICVFGDIYLAGVPVLQSPTECSIVVDGIAHVWVPIKRGFGRLLGVDCGLVADRSKR